MEEDPNVWAEPLAHCRSAERPAIMTLHLLGLKPQDEKLGSYKSASNHLAMGAYQIGVGETGRLGIINFHSCSDYYCFCPQGS